MRRSQQEPLPLKKESSGSGKYDIYPALRIAVDKIHAGYKSLADEIKRHSKVAIDGFPGVPFNEFRDNIDGILKKEGLSVQWIETDSFLNDHETIAALKKPFLGGNDPLFGTRCTLSPEDFFKAGAMKNLTPACDADIKILIGPGASLAGTEGLLIYIDIPKNEIQYRARAGSIRNFGEQGPSDPKKMYKGFYFVDWPVFNRHKQKVFSSIDIFIDGQRTGMPVWMTGKDLRDSLSLMSRSPFRARPWFEPGPWGGKWILNNIPGLNKNVDNYAWSFELISPENGILIESSQYLLEVSFDCIMYHAAEDILGDSFTRFQYDFPIRFDFLDTFDGGNLSIQCHPRPDYTKTCFGEDFTQEETYYILDAKENASVWLGFQETINPAEFRTALEESRDMNVPLDAGRFIQALPSQKHDLFLIPYGTIHGSGKNNLVLEISTTPYIFTFKMYDWLRNDLDGKPRTLNIERALENLFFERKGDYVREKLVSKPVQVDAGHGWRLFDLPTHETHLIRIMRYHFTGSIEIKTRNKCLVMNLVEGTTIKVVAEAATQSIFSYAETFIIPAATGSVKITNSSDSEAVLICAFVK